VINGWDKGVMAMLKCKQATFTIAPEFFCGEGIFTSRYSCKCQSKFDVEIFSGTTVKNICKDGGIIKKVTVLLVEGQK